MTKRNIGNEIITSLEEIKAWKRGEVKLRTSAVELPRAADVLGSAGPPLIDLEEGKL